MASVATHSGERWSKADEQRLIQMAKDDKTTSRIASALGRTPSAIRAKASELGVTLKPKDEKGT